MQTSTNLAVSFFATQSLAGLSDTELVSATRGLVGRSNQLLAALLAHLGEVDARGLHRSKACASLYTYCIYDLRFSEDEAYRRVTAARLVRRFPALLEAIATGELHLTGLLMLGPHLTEHNLVEVLARAKHRTKKELARLVRQLDPLPEVPARIEPLGPAPARLNHAAPTWSVFVQSFAPVRELEPGDRPREWGATSAETMMNDVAEQPVAPALESPAPARLEPERYKVQFTASEEYVKLVDEAKALLSHSDPRISLDELHLRAMRALVAELQRSKQAATAKPRSPSKRSPRASAPEAKQEQPRQRGRYVPAAVRRAVFARDQGRCTYCDETGQRCRETHGLELHHLRAFALGGEHTAENITLRCRAHNMLAAEQDFGKDLVERAKDSSDHQTWVVTRSGNSSSATPRLGS